VDIYYAGRLSERFTQKELESGSGRSSLRILAWDVIRSGSLRQILFGHGSSASLKLLETGAHNEWLEFQLCYGLIGLLTLATFYCLLAKYHREVVQRSLSGWWYSLLKYMYLG
jgi:hypothetical protein